MTEMWERQKGEDGQLEPMLWFDRFTDFLHQDAPRSIARMVNEWRDAVGRPRAKDVPGSWRKQSLRWRWRDRAQAWDVEQRRLRDEQWASREVLPCGYGLLDCDVSHPPILISRLS